MKIFSRLALVLAVSASLWAETPDQTFQSLAEEFLQGYLRLNPEVATTLGEHRYDGRWSDVSRAGVQEAVQFQHSTLRKLKPLLKANLSSVNGVDRDILQHYLQGQIWANQELKEWEWNPLLYNPGPALFAIVARDYAPLPQRLGALAERLEGLPIFLKQAREVLDNPPALHTQTAIQQNQGTLNFVQNELESYIQKAGPDLQPRLRSAQSAAVAALQEHGTWLENHLLPRSHGDFRLGPQRYRRKLYFTLESSLSAEQLAHRARRDLLDTQIAMARVARPLYARYFQKSAESLGDAEVSRAVLQRLADDRPNSSTIVPQARQSLEKAGAFVRQHRLVSLPTQPCEIIEMPEFNRGVAIAYCDSPGPLEQGGTTYYAIAPTPRDWSPERATSFYREYNNAMLDDLTVHEAMPGHFLQLMHANRFQAPTRLRAVLQSGTFVEGWATYAEQMMVSHNYGGPEVAMQQLKMRLRLILNCLLDQGVHAGSLQEDEAVRWLMKEGYQEEGEAVGKWKRACLTSAQLSTYYVGNCELNDLIAEYRKSHPALSLQQVHDRVLSFGSPAPRYVVRLLKGL